MNFPAGILIIGKSGISEVGVVFGMTVTSGVCLSVEVLASTGTVCNTISVITMGVGDDGSLKIRPNQKTAAPPIIAARTAATAVIQAAFTSGAWPLGSVDLSLGDGLIDHPPVGHLIPALQVCLRKHEIEKQKENKS